jgi:predicted amidohydrolase
MRALNAAAVQMEHAAGDKARNLEKIARLVDGAARENVELVAFPECCITGYWFLRHLSRGALQELAEPVPDGPATQHLLRLARGAAMTIGAGLVEIDGDGNLFNTYVVASPDGAVHRHRKLHTFVSEHMVSGSEITVFDSVPLGCTIGVLTCYDNNIIENVRLTALQGADIILAPHQTGGCRTHDPNIMGVIDQALWHGRKSDREAIEREFRGDKGRGWLLRWLPSRAHDNGVFYLFSNGVGIDDDEVRTGNAMIIDPFGRVLDETWVADDAMVVATLDPSLREDNTGQRWMKARRPDLYRPLAEATGQEVDMRTARFAGKGG